ncbi:MAG: aspartate--tRNA(Asn) ligase, partial [Candidatus Altiarchaeales archaeon WOR_SM1_79]
MRTQYSNEITAELEGKEVVLSGWAHEIRDLGKLKFLILRDQEGFIQVCAKEGSSPHEVLAAIKAISKESVVRVKGKVKVSPQAPGGAEIVPDSINIISKSLSPLPLDVTGKVPADLDTRLNNRFMDLRKPEIASIFKIRDQILSAGRESFENEGFIELHTPKIIASASEGGTELFPISYFDKEAFLAQSPQLYKQMMMATGFDKVYEVTYYFRAEEHDTIRHLNEVTAFDSEISFIKDEEDVIGRVERLVRDIIKRASECETELKILNDYHSKSKKEEIKIPVPEIPFRRIPYDKALDLLAGEGKKVEWGEDLDTESEKMLGRIVKEKFGNEFYFLTKYPLGI